MQLEQAFLQDIRQIWQSARQKTYTLVNRAMINAHWEIGRRIFEEEQNGEARAQYGTFLLRELAIQLIKELGKGLDERELRRMRQFYQCFPIRETLSPELTWSHYRLLLRIEDPDARSYYLNEAATQSWGTRLLERNIQSGYYNRIVSTQEITSGAVSYNKDNPLTAGDLIKDPYVLEFLGLDAPTGFSENDLETAILGKLQHFLLEMGKGFAFVRRQYSLKTDTKLFYIDLVFYNYLLKCFVLIELKITELTHQDIGQLDMYVRIFDDLKKNATDNPTIGIILCADKDATVVKYSVLDDNKQLFASQYKMVLPSEAELIHEIESSKQSFSSLSEGV